jgi:hypothetical protein
MAFQRLLAEEEARACDYERLPGWPAFARDRMLILPAAVRSRHSLHDSTAEDPGEVVDRVWLVQ